MTITPRPPLSCPAGLIDRGAGDSIGVGSACSIYGTTDHQSMFCAEFGAIRQNICVSGTGSHGSTQQMYANYQAYGARLAVNNWWEDGHNPGLYPNTLTPSTVAGEDRAKYALIWSKTDIAASAAGLTKVGTWVASATDYGDKASVMLVGTPMAASAVGDYITWTATTGDNIFINCPSGPGAIGRHLGSFDVQQNGIVIDSYAGDGQGNNGPLDSSPPLTLHARFIFNVRPGDVFKIINTGGSGPLTIISVGTLRPAWDCENAERLLPPRPNSACISGGCYHLGSNTGTPAGFDAIDAAIIAVSELMAGNGYPARITQTNNYLTGSSMPAPGYEHPNDTGQMQIYNARRASYSRADQIKFTWTAVAHGVASSGGAANLPQSIGVRDGKTFEYWIRLDPPSGAVLTCSQGISYIDPPSNIFMGAASTLSLASCGGADIPYPVSEMNNSWPGKIFLPNATITEPTQIHGRCVLA